MIPALSSVWNKEFTTFNEQGQPIQRRLNLIQRFFRLLGFYKNTRLSVVGSIALNVLFKQEQKRSSQEKIAINNVIRKYNQSSAHFFFMLPAPFPFCHLGQERLTTGETVTYQGFILGDGCSFTIKIQENNKTKRECCIELNKTPNDSKRLNLTRIQEWQIDGNLQNYKANEASFLINPNDCLARCSYLFLSKIVNDSPNLEGIDMVNILSDDVSTTNSLIGSAKVAQNYGFSGTSNTFYSKDVLSIERADGLKLERGDTHRFAKQCQLLQPISVDFLVN